MNTGQPNWVLSTLHAAPRAGQPTPPVAAAMPAEPRRKKPQPVPFRRVREPEFVQAVDRWLAGGPWECASASFRPYHGVCVTLTERGDQLLEKGVPVLSRLPTVLHEFPPGTTTGNRLEARALCAVAVRGDAGMYRA